MIEFRTALKVLIIINTVMNGKIVRNVILHRYPCLKNNIIEHYYGAVGKFILNNYIGLMLFVKE